MSTFLGYHFGKGDSPSSILRERSHILRTDQHRLNHHKFEW
ncbi:Uncharacterised protein [Vibrio cholerae]|nr:Uncharacterised protein [Vibrio cholerae]CSI57422.1 Uncharacterised protein [Vibrio cholerae]